MELMKMKNEISAKEAGLRLAAMGYAPKFDVPVVHELAYHVKVSA